MKFFLSTFVLLAIVTWQISADTASGDVSGSEGDGGSSSNGSGSSDDSGSSGADVIGSGSSGDDVIGSGSSGDEPNDDGILIIPESVGKDGSVLPLIDPEIPGETPPEIQIEDIVQPAANDEEEVPVPLPVPFLPV